jgi:hypothetical protein
MAFEFEILDAVEENELRFRSQVFLFSKDFMCRLAKLMPGVADSVRGYSDWYWALREIRGPAAHRIPIYAVPAIMTPQDAHKWRRTFDEAMKQEELDKTRRLLAERM